MDATRDHFGRGTHRPRFLKTHPRFLLSFHLLGFLACAPKTLHGYKRNQATIHPSFHDLALLRDIGLLEEIILFSLQNVRMEGKRNWKNCLKNRRLLFSR